LLRGRYQNHLSNENLTDLFENGGLEGHVDIPRIKKGSMGGAFWSAFWICPTKIDDYTDENYADIVRATLQQLDLFQQLTSRYPRYFTPSSTSAEAAVTFKKDRKLISPIGIEGLHQIGNSASILRLYYSLGARYVTLTWNCHNIYADAAITKNEEGHFAPSTPLWHGISQKGREIVYEMNRLGMLVDLSHVSKDTMIDALVGSDKWGGWEGSIAPPIFSHSSVYSICPHPRNVPDDVLQMVRKRNSVVMINFAADFISCTTSDSESGLPETDPENATLLQVVKHIRYIGELIGYDHVGIGSDYDGIDYAPRGLEDVSKFPDLVAELLRQGISHRNVIKVIGGNILRVWAEADAVSGMMKPWKMPLEDDIVNRF
jgi:membrane dipeptidase